MTTRKRPLDSGAAAESSAKKVHSFFDPQARAKTATGSVLPSPETLFHYLNGNPFDPASAALTTPSAGPSTSTARAKIPISFYDLDGTLIKTRTGNSFPKDRTDWAWWHATVPAFLKAEVEAGRHVIVISNQGSKVVKARTEWKAKVPLIAASIPAVPLRVIAAFSMTDVYRKPNIGMFQVVQKLYADEGVDIDIERSVYVGDAAGRLSNKTTGHKDHSDTDYKWALNVGIPFVTPEEHFLRMPRPSFPEPPVGFIPARIGNLAELPAIVPSHTPITHSETEIVLFVGSPASGKTSFFRRHFEPAGYEHVNQDILRSRDKCLAVAELLIKTGKRIVVDNTNRNAATRAHWVDLAERLHVPIRLFHFLCPVELARHNNMYRAVYAPEGEAKRELLPATAFYGYKSQFEPPQATEGFDEIRSVNFVWEGTDEQRRFWDMYMLETK